MTRLSLALTILCFGCGDSGNNTMSPDMAVSMGPDLATGGAPTCAAYCAAIQANCTAGNQQYTTMNNCINSCAAIPAGTSADTSGNTLGCRLYHANAAKADPATHCVHAGPGGAGMCGTNCQGYCQIALKYCTGTSQIYANATDCATVCATFPDTAKFNVTDTTLQNKKATACLLYHVQEASSAPPDHCIGDLERSDGGVNSVTCNM
jgi:hypothetical protein